MKHYLKRAGFLLTAIISGICLSSCESSDSTLFSFTLPGVDAITEIDHTAGEILVRFADTGITAKTLAADFEISEGARLMISGKYQESGITTANYEQPFTLDIVSENGKSLTSWLVRPSNNDYTSGWGLGGFMSECVSRGRDYEWYICQDTTGPHSNANCAPTSIVMACMWADADFPFRVEDARQMYHPEGGGWTTMDIENCLSYFQADYSVRPTPADRELMAELITGELDKGNLLLFCIDVHYLQHCRVDTFRVDKYYSTIYLGTGHCIVCKGYKVVDGNLFYEIYDPGGINFKYADGHCKGRGRYYRAEDIYTASFASWRNVFIFRGLSG